MRCSRFVLASVLLLSLSVSAFSQVKIYTRKALLSDFPNKVCKVVISSESLFELAYKAEVSTRWKASPYEFCTPEFYQQNALNNDYYFLRMVTDKGIVYLELTKGGDKKNVDRAKRPVLVVRMPVASRENPSGRELVYLGAFLDVIQSQATAAMDSDVKGYGGLSRHNMDSLEGYTIYTDRASGDSVFVNSVPNSLIYLCVSPGKSSYGSECYKMLLGADTHKLLLFEKNRYRSPSDAFLTKKQIYIQKQRGGNFAE